MKRKLLFIITIGIFMISQSANAQYLGVSGQFGYAGPQGNVFTDATSGESLASFGIGYDIDILYTLEKFDNKLGVGVMYSGAVIFGENSNSALDFGVYGLSLAGVKAQYRLLEPSKKVSPYASLGLGLSEFATPDITINGVTTPGESAYSLGLRPEVGLDLGGFLISVSYHVPMKYTVESDTGDFDGTAGLFNINVGYRTYMDLSSLF